MSATRSSSSVTPVLLTFNEEPNIGRTLSSLAWARDVVVLDSGSTDRTEKIAREFPFVRWFRRPFDTHGRQWTYALRETGIESEYILALDADMATSPALVDELESRFLAGSFAGAMLPFEYWLMGRPLRGSLLRPQLRLFRRDAVQVGQEGHTQTFAVEGPIYLFRSRLRHDDRKSVDRWIGSQVAYSKKELDRFVGEERPSLKDHLRRSGLMPVVVGSVAYLRSGGPFAGRAAVRYAWERVVFECLLAMRLFDKDAEKDESRAPSKSSIG